MPDEKNDGGTADGRRRREREKEKEKEKTDRKRAQLKLAVRKRVEAERAAHQAVLRLLEDDVTQEVLAQLGGKITPAHYDDVIEERALEMLCGFPLCNKHLKYVAKQQFKIVTKTNKVYDLSRRKCFCSNFCFGASQYFASQIPSGPLGMREGEMPPQFKFLQQGDKYQVALCGDEVLSCTLHKVVRKDDIEGQDPSVACSHPSSRSHSSSPSSSDEDAFVSSIVGRDHKHHFAHPSEATVEEEREKLREQTNSRGGREWNSDRNIKGSNKRDIMKDVESKTRLEMNGDNDEDAAVVSRASDSLRNSDPSLIHPENTKPGRYLAATNQTGSCLDTRLMLQVSQMTLAPDPEIRRPLTGDPVMKQDVAPDLSSKDHSLLDNDVSLPQTISPNAGSRDASPLAPCISSYGISASGAAALRKLLVHHRSAKGAEWHVPDAVRKPVNQGSIAEKIAATLRSWRTEEAVEFLHCDGTTSSLKPSDHPEDAVHGKQKEVARNYAEMQRVADLQKEHVTKFLKGLHHVIEVETEEPEIPPLPSSCPPSQIRMRIVGDGLHVALSNLLAPLGVSLSDISSELGKLLRLLRFTPNNIVHKPGEWTIIAATLMQLLSSKIPVLHDALSLPSCRAQLESTLRKFAISNADVNDYLSIFNPGPSKSGT